MTVLPDLTIPYSGLRFSGEDRAVCDIAAPDHDMISALLMRVVRAAAEALSDCLPVTPVSVTMDVTGVLQGPGEMTFTSHVDRRTRTLIFIGGEAFEGAIPLLKATAVYRIG